MLESVVSNKVNNIGPSFTNTDCDLTWIEATHLKEVCSSSSRLYRKRYYPSTFEKEAGVYVQGSEGLWKRRRDDLVVKGHLRRSKRHQQHKEKRMTRAGCCNLKRQGRPDHSSQSSYHRNRSLSQSNVGTCIPNHQSPVIENNFDSHRNNSTNRRHFNSNLLHNISSHSPHGFTQAKDCLTTNLSTNINNYCNIQNSQTTQSQSPCGQINQYPISHGNSVIFRQPQQTIRRRHHTSDLTSLYQSTASSPYLQSRSINIATSQPSISACTIPNRTISTNTSSFPLVNRSFCQNPNQLRFATYPVNPYSPQQSMFSRSSVPATTILPHNSAFCSTVQMPTVIGDVVSSTPCHQCAIMAGSGLNTFSNLSSMFRFSVAPTPTSLITLAAVSGQRIHSSQLSYVPVHAINNWPNNHHYLPAAWSYNDLTSILHNSTARQIFQDHLAQRFLSSSTNVGIQFVMMTPSSVMGSNDHSQIRHHLIPVTRTDNLSPIAVSRYLPIIDHIPIIDQPKPGITKQELDQIPIRKFVKVDTANMASEDGKEKCMICLEDFMSNEIIRLLKCSHDFHSSCVERWLKINRTCPLCRADAAGYSYGKS